MVQNKLQLLLEIYKTQGRRPPQEEDAQVLQRLPRSLGRIAQPKGLHTAAASSRKSNTGIADQEPIDAEPPDFDE